jgi:hypothetical protein
MGKVIFDMSISLDGFVKASNATPAKSRLLDHRDGPLFERRTVLTSPAL